MIRFAWDKDVKKSENQKKITEKSNKKKFEELVKKVNN
jgi:hypothetical protein